MKCHHCETEIHAGDGHPTRADHHRFCYELVIGELADQFADAAREMGWPEIRPGVFTTPGGGTFISESAP